MDSITYNVPSIADGGALKHGGLYSPRWGYSEADMLAIQEKAKSLGYL